MVAPMSVRLKSAAMVVVVCLVSACSPTDEGTPIIDFDVRTATVADQDAFDAAPDATARDADMSVADEPARPPTLQRWLTGDDADAVVPVGGPGLILMGGGGEPDEAFHWWRDLLNGGDVVVLRVSGSDGYNDYLFDTIGGVDSVETLKVDSRTLAEDPYVAWRIDHAEGVFLAGGDQWDYISLWSQTGVQDALQRVHARGGVIGGTSAGLAVLGDRAFSAENGSVTTAEALADPFNEFMRFDDEFLSLPGLEQTVTDSHFRERDRMGRLVAFVARMWTDGFDAPRGIGIDESTALLIGPAGREVVGSGAIYEVSAALAPAVCRPSERLEWADIAVVRTTASGSQPSVISARDGALIPADPY